MIDEVVVTDSSPLPEDASEYSRIKVLSVAKLLAQSIHEDGSVSPYPRHRQAKRLIVTKIMTESGSGTAGVQ